MKTLFLRFLGTGLLAIVFAAFAFLAFEQHSDTASGEQSASSIEPAIQNHTPTSSSSPKRSDVYFAAIEERPLFSETRRPRVPDVQPAPEPVVVVAPKAVEPDLPELNLLGVMAGGAKTRALISVDGATPIWLSEGETVGGWTISKAGADWLEVAAGQKTIRLDLFE